MMSADMFLKYKNSHLLTKWAGVLLAIAFGVLYFLTSVTRIPFGDSVGFVVSMDKGEWLTYISAIDHFLYINTGVLIKKIFPVLMGKEIAKWISVVSSAICILLFYHLLLLVKTKVINAIFATIILGFSYSFWRNAVNIEMYTFNLVFVLLIYHFLIKAYQNSNYLDLIFAAIMTGVSLMAHIQNILLLPAIFFCSIKILQGKSLKSNWFKMIIPILIPIAFMALYNFINSFATKEEEVKLLMSDSVWVRDTFSKSMVQYLQDIGKSLLYLIYNFWFLTPLFFFGLYRIIRDGNNFGYFLITIGLPCFAFATFYAVSDNYTYFLPSYIIVLMIIVMVVESTKRIEKIMYGGLLFPLFYWVSLTIAANTEKGQHFHQTKLYKGGLYYYLLPWQNGNKGILEYTINKETAIEDTSWMTDSAEEYIQMHKNRYSLEQLKLH